MQKTSLRASILIWSIFLSLVVTLSFVLISAKVNQNIRLNNFMEEFIDIDNKINNLTNSGLEWDISDSETLNIIEPIYNIKQNDNLVFSFSWNTDFTWSIKLKNWWPLYFENYSYSWSYSDLINLYSTGLIYEWNILNFTWNLNSTYDRVELSFKNLWWFSSFVFKSSIDMIWTWIHDRFKVTRNIWWIDIEKTIIEK